MYVIDIIPLSRIPRPNAQILSYFNNKQLQFGAIVEVMLKNRKIRAVVIKCDPLQTRKISLRKESSFELKKISKIISESPQVSQTQIDIARYIASEYYAPLGISLKTVLPPFLGKRGYNIKANAPNVMAEAGNARFVFTDYKKHYKDYEKMIKGHIRAGRQVLLMAAENTAGEYFLARYKRLNPLYVSGSISNKEFYGIWDKTQKAAAKLIIGTRTALFLPFSRLGLIIVDDESNDAYKSDMSPRYNAADVARYIAHIYGADIVYSSRFPRLETYALFKPRFSAKHAKVSVQDMRKELASANYSIFSRMLKAALFEAYSKHKHMIIYIPRRGHATSLICRICGAAVLCPNCSVSLVLHTRGGAEVLMCHHCAYSRPKPLKCPSCSKPGLKARGTGTQKVVSELKKLFSYQGFAPPDIIRFDSDAANNDTDEERALLKLFTSKAPSILVTTQIIFSHIYGLYEELRQMPILGIINADALIHIPDFRSEEFLFRQIYALSRFSDNVILQTHNPDDPAINMLDSPQTFTEKELASRKQFGYPPYTRIAKLTFRHIDFKKSEHEARITAAKLRQALRNLRNADDFIITGPFQGFISKERGKYAWHVIIKLKMRNSKYEADDIKARNYLLNYAPPGCIIDIDPKIAI